MISRYRGLRHLLTLVAGYLAAVALVVPTLSAPVPQFEAASCRLPDIANVASRVSCGIVRVPRDYAHPDGPIYALAVVVVRSERQPARPDPVVYISGGPGGPLTVYSGYQARHPYAADRDLVLVDQRGTGRSEPRLCPDLQVNLVTAMLAVVTEPSPASLDADRAAHAACRQELAANGVDPDDFGTVATAEDFEGVRQALGLARWNVVGEFRPIDIGGVVLAQVLADLDATACGNARRYHPGWAYHGLLVGPATSAALFLRCLLAGHLLRPDLLLAMQDGHQVGGAIPGHPWTLAAYGLGLMVGHGDPPGQYLGHTGGGPGSTAAVYQGPAHPRATDAPPRRSHQSTTPDP